MAVMVGMSGSVKHTVSSHDTAIALGSGAVEVLGTPRVVAWCEEATMRAVEPGLRESDVCVGIRVAIEHVHPSAVGSTVTASATVTASDGRIVTLEVEAHQPSDEGDVLIAHGEITRAVLNRERFLDRVGKG